jgi:hypothetical protein
MNRSRLGADGLIHLGVRGELRAVSADTSSAAAGTAPVVGAAAAAFWALIAAPIPCKVPTAAVSASGYVDTNDIRFSSRTWTDPKAAAVTTGCSHHRLAATNRWFSCERLYILFVSSKLFNELLVFHLIKKVVSATGFPRRGIREPCHGRPLGLGIKDASTRNNGPSPTP